MNEHKPWREALKKGFELPDLTPDEQSKLRALVMGQISELKPQDSAPLSLPSATSTPHDVSAALLLKINTKVLVRKFKRWGAGYVLAAAAAASITFALVRPVQESDVKTADKTADMAALQRVRSLPADFDLEGDSSRLPELLRELSNTTNVQISARIPDEVLKTYSLGQGRLITWHGAPAVAVNLDLRPELVGRNGPRRSATLVIVGAPRPPAQQLLEPEFGNRPSFANDLSGPQPSVQPPVRSWQNGQSRFLLVNDPME